MENKYHPSEVADLIELCAKDEAVADDIVKELIIHNYTEKIVNEAVHYLSHFATDVDTREENPEYDLHMRKRLMEFVEKIKKTCRRD
jgi:hypothetical protein